MSLLAPGEDTLTGLAVPGVHIGQTGLVADEEVPEEAIDHVGRILATPTKASTWAVADWLLLKERRFGRRYGESCSTIGLSYDTSSAWPVVAERVPPERRRPELSFSHHAQVAHLSPEDQSWYLGWAARDLDDDEAGARPLPHSALVLRRKIKDDEDAALAADAAENGTTAVPEGSVFTEEEAGLDEAAVKLLGSTTLSLAIQCQAKDVAEVRTMLGRTADALENWAGSIPLDGFSARLDPSEIPK